MKPFSDQYWTHFRQTQYTFFLFFFRKQKQKNRKSKQNKTVQTGQRISVDRNFKLMRSLYPLGTVFPAVGRYHRTPSGRGADAMQCKMLGGGIESVFSSFFYKKKENLKNLVDSVTMEVRSLSASLAPSSSMMSFCLS